MNFIMLGAPWLWATVSRLWCVSAPLRRARVLPAVAMALLAAAASAEVPPSAEATPSAEAPPSAEEIPGVEVPATQNPYVRVVATLYSQAKYQEALSRLEKALEWKANEAQTVVWLKLMKGVLQAELGQDSALGSFRQALALDAEAQLPVRGSWQMRKRFEQARDTAEQPQGQEAQAEELFVDTLVGAPPPRRLGLSLSVRGEADVLGLGLSLAISPAVSLGYSGEHLGAALTLLVQPPSPGLRLEGRLHPLTLGWVRPYVGLGGTAFFREADTQGQRTLLGGVSGRVALGADVQWNSRLHTFADVAYERFFTGAERYRTDAVLFSVGVGLFP